MKHRNIVALAGIFVSSCEGSSGSVDPETHELRKQVEEKVFAGMIECNDSYYVYGSGATIYELNKPTFRFEEVELDNADIANGFEYKVRFIVYADFYRRLFMGARGQPRKPGEWRDGSTEGVPVFGAASIGSNLGRHTNMAAVINGEMKIATYNNRWPDELRDDGCKIQNEYL